MTPLTVTLDEHRSRLVKDAARAQGVTYKSLLHALIDYGLESGRRPIVLEPWGRKKPNENNQK